VQDSPLWVPPFETHESPATHPVHGPLATMLKHHDLANVLASSAVICTLSIQCKVCNLPAGHRQARDQWLASALAQPSRVLNH